MDLPKGIKPVGRMRARKVKPPKPIVKVEASPKPTEPIVHKRTAYTRRTHCHAGHELTPDNIYVWKASHRTKVQHACKTCRRRRSQEYDKVRVRPKKGKQILTHCKAGHEYTLKNTHVTKDNKRICKRCRARYSAEYEKRRALRDHEAKVLRSDWPKNKNIEDQPGVDSRGAGQETKQMPVIHLGAGERV